MDLLTRLKDLMMGCPSCHTMKKERRTGESVQKPIEGVVKEMDDNTPVTLLEEITINTVIVDTNSEEIFYQI